MRKVYFIGLILILIWSCSSSNENTNSQKENDPINENNYNELSTQKKPGNEFGTSTEIIDTLKKHHLGLLRIGDPIDKVIAKLKDKYIIQYDSIPQTEEETSYFYFYSVSDYDNKSLFKIHTSDHLNIKNVINTFEVLSNRFITDQGIKIGDNVIDLKRKYTLVEADFNYDEGLWVNVREFPGCFFFDINVKGIDNFNYEMPEIDKIPEQLKINRIVIY